MTSPKPPENAKKVADDTTAAVKDFTEDLLENAKKFADDTTAAVKDFTEDLLENAKLADKPSRPFPTGRRQARRPAGLTFTYPTAGHLLVEVSRCCAWVGRKPAMP